MKLIKNKMAEEGTGTALPLSYIIAWIILIALAVFAFVWYISLRTKTIAIFKLF